MALFPKPRPAGAALEAGPRLGSVSQKAWPVYALLAVTVFAFWLLKEAARFALETSPASGEPLFYAVALFSLMAAYASPTPSDRAFRVLSGGVGIVLALAAAPIYLGYPVANWAFADMAERLFTFGPGLAIGCGILAYWRPVALIGCGLFPLVERALVPHISGLPIGSLDIYPVYEVALFLGVCAAIAAGARRYAPALASEERYLTLTWITALGLHFGNYFYSGVAKLQMSGPWLAWVFENATNDTALLAAWYNGRWLLSGDPALTIQLAETLGSLNTPINAFVLLIQIAAPLAILRLGWIKLQTILYDLMHIGIFFIVGIMFWKWILLNLAFLISARWLARNQYDAMAKAMGVAAVILGVFVAQTAQLAWYNTPALTSRFLVANTDDGAQHRVPISFFLNQAYSVSHARFFVDTGAHFPTSPMGNTPRYGVMKAAKECDLSKLRNPPVYRDAAQMTQDNAATTRFVQAHHAFFLNLSGDGRFNYVMFPFHHFSNPADYESFYALDKRRITSYTFIARSHCISAEDGQLQSDIRHETRYDIPIR